MLWVLQKKWMKRGLPDTIADALSTEEVSRELLAAVMINELATRNSRILGQQTAQYGTAMMVTTNRCWGQAAAVDWNDGVTSDCR